MKVKQLSIDEFKDLQENCGGWVSDLKKLIGSFSFFFVVVVIVVN